MNFLRNLALKWNWHHVLIKRDSYIDDEVFFVTTPGIDFFKSGESSSKTYALTFKWFTRELSIWWGDTEGMDGDRLIIRYLCKRGCHNWKNLQKLPTPHNGESVYPLPCLHRCTWCGKEKTQPSIETE